MNAVIIGPLTIVCFVQGVGGAVQYPKDYLKEAYKLVRERGGVCIADEVGFFMVCLQKVLQFNPSFRHLLKAFSG